MLFLGIDGGGTKTEFALFDSKGVLLADISKDSACYWQYPIGKLLTVIDEGVTHLLRETNASMKDIAAVGFGMAGMGENPAKDDVSIKMCHDYFKGIPIGIRNDVEVAFLGSLGLNAGIHVVVGTGAMAVGMDDYGSFARSGGWGHEIGDEGSGYWLGKKTMELFTKQSDGRLPKTCLYDLVKEKLNFDFDFDVMDIFQKEYYNDRTKTASLQTILCEAAGRGDGCAIEAYEDAVKELVLLASAIRQKLKFSGTVRVSYSGGVFKAGSFVLELFKKYLTDMGFSVSAPLLSPAQGAVLLAAKQVGKHNEILEKFKEIKNDNLEDLR